MTETIDPITWLKDFVVNGKRIELNKQSNELEFENSSIRLPLNAQTAWKREKGGHYTIGSLWMAYHMRDEKLSVAMREAMKLNIINVDFNDKQEIIKFFTGQTSETNKIDTAIRAQTLIKKADIK